MVNLFRRMRKLNAILDIRAGTGAAILPNLTSATKEFPAVTRLHLTYAQKIYQGHAGARHFWRKCMPRLKYHNPGISMTVRQTQDQEVPATLTIYFAERISSTANALVGSTALTDAHAPPPEKAEKTAVMNLKDLSWTDIWTRVQAATGVQEIATTSEDAEALKKLEEMRIKGEKDKVRVQSMRQAKKDQERMLAEARGEVEKLKQT
ncbi:hypothetical protein N7510_009267 [Penicillium lagena]|uniref:uncharacterized protein n=1 Tax=Penicillium lagena TaxID=94218 RepID=UPI00253FE092|nr:uncharacterized protein N7510_009267 [Penicillium lagena]KAJ5606486.1 hypothetical protein N7510_009267 [Penicillium lagena]